MLTFPEPQSELHLQFEQQLQGYLQERNNAQIEQLLARFAPLATRDQYLAQWCAYARSYLASQDDGIEQAIAWLVGLQAETDLAPRLYEAVLNLLGICYEMNEQWDRALRCYQESITLDEAAQRQWQLSKTLNNLALLYWKMRDCAAAIACAQRSIHILTQEPADDGRLFDLALAWDVLGMAQRQQQDRAAAQAAFEQSLALCRQIDNAYGEGFVCTDLGHLHRAAGEVDKARHYYERARQLTLATENYRQLADVVYGLGLLQLQTGAATAEVHGLLDEALRLTRATNNHEIVTDILLSRAGLQEQAGDIGAALSASRAAVATVESLRANIILPDDRARMTAARVDAYEQMVRRLCQEGAAASLTEAFHYAEMAKARTLIELLGQQRVRSSARIPTDWLAEERTLRGALHALYQAAAANQELIEIHERDLNQLRERIRLYDAEFDSFHTVNPLTVAAIQARLPAGALLLEYFTVGDEILLFALTRHDLWVTHLPLRVTELQRAFKQVGENNYGPLHNLTRTENHYLRQPWILAKLYEQLIGALGPALEKVVQQADLLCIVPHGLLHYVPFHALYQPTATGPHYLAERDGVPRPLLYAPSATTLLDYCQTKPRATGTGCLALGYNGATLTQAASEAQAVVKAIGGVAHTAAAATRMALLTEAAQYRYVHISCHGWFNPTWPLSSAIALADNTLDVTDTLRELHLNAELVCLSACETGRSHILRGDELIGLARAFLYAGTPAVLVSQWVVDELSTNLFFEHFYTELHALHNQPSPPDAATALALSRTQQYLRQLTTREVTEILQARAAHPQEAATQLAYLCATDPMPQQERPFAHPYYWASFFLVGDRFTPAL